MSDLISRQDAIKTVEELNLLINYGTGYGTICTSDVLRRINALPSADAVEVVRCKDCKWHLNGHLCKQLSQYGSIETPPSFYCGFAERR